jgi:glycine/D-amino acid oxidase-like deaminating enzyme
VTTQHIDTLIIGAGHSGLATGYHLKRLGLEFLIVDGNCRVGDTWRRHDDDQGLDPPPAGGRPPGLALPGEPRSHPTRDDVADHLEMYALRFDLPIRMQTRVDRVARRAGGFVATLGEETIECANVVVATGACRRDLDWIDIPVLGDLGWPEKHRGAVESIPGLFFCGPSRRYAFSSMLLPGVARDAAYVARAIAGADRTIVAETKGR